MLFSGDKLVIYYSLNFTCILFYSNGKYLHTYKDSSALHNSLFYKDGSISKMFLQIFIGT